MIRLLWEDSGAKSRKKSKRAMLFLCLVLINSHSFFESRHKERGRHVKWDRKQGLLRKDVKESSRAYKQEWRMYTKMASVTKIPKGTLHDML